jgi:AcrR family transcriptional regulator
MGNAEDTRERILNAATLEFAAYGVAGARVDRIAKEAEANKSLIYVYFGSKERLFTTVFARHLKTVYETVRFSAEDLPGYSARLFDFAMDHPDLMRLVMWWGLEQRKDWPLEEWVSLDMQLKEIAKVQRAGNVSKRYAPEFLLTLILTLSSAWTSANPFGTSIDPDADRHRTVLRRSVSQAVEQLCQT